MPEKSMEQVMRPIFDELTITLQKITGDKYTFQDEYLTQLASALREAGYGHIDDRDPSDMEMAENGMMSEKLRERLRKLGYLHEDEVVICDHWHYKPECKSCGGKGWLTREKTKRIERSKAMPDKSIEQVLNGFFGNPTYHLALSDEVKKDVASALKEAGYATKAEHEAELRKEGWGKIENFEVCGCLAKLHGVYDCESEYDHKLCVTAPEDCLSCHGLGIIRKEQING